MQDFQFSAFFEKKIKKATKWKTCIGRKIKFIKTSNLMVKTLDDQIIGAHFNEHRLFVARYFAMVNDYDTNEKAYEALENLHVERYGVRKYANYDSFRRAKAYHHGKYNGN